MNEIRVEETAPFLQGYGFPTNRFLRFIQGLNVSYHERAIVMKSIRLYKNAFLVRSLPSDYIHL